MERWEVDSKKDWGGICVSEHCCPNSSFSSSRLSVAKASGTTSLHSSWQLLTIRSFCSLNRICSWKCWVEKVRINCKLLAFPCTWWHQMMKWIYLKISWCCAEVKEKQMLLRWHLSCTTETTWVSVCELLLGFGTSLTISTSWHSVSTCKLFLIWARAWAP